MESTKAAVASSEEVTDVAFKVGWPRDFEIGSDLQEDDELPVGSDLQEDNELPIGNDLQEDNELPLAQVRSLRSKCSTIAAVFFAHINESSEGQYAVSPGYHNIHVDEPCGMVARLN